MPSQLLTVVSSLILALTWLGTAAAIPAGLEQVEHIVIFMQENRAFDHYYGTLRGVRGFNDRSAIPLFNGLNSFYQPNEITNPESYQLPWELSTMNTSVECMDAPEMDYPCDILMFNQGRYDAWNTARSEGTGMSYWTRETLPFYYTLFDNFAVGDQYFQATFTQTDPNRLHLFTGSNGLSVGQEAVLDNSEPTPGWSWPTMAEVLQEAGITWKVYQQEDNFDDNGFAWFAQFQNAQPGNPLYDYGMVNVPDLVAAFGADLANGTLPQVSWIVGPANLSEHATYHPAMGEDLTARIIHQLSLYPDMYATTVFILNYDEGGQFYDHHWTPTPPIDENDGISTVTTDGEITQGMYPHIPLPKAPIGLGFRVPLLIISPWTRGAVTVSQVFDHTSTLQFIEQRFAVKNPNISPWRRVVSGNLLAAFDFDNPDYSWPTTLPDTSNYTDWSIWECDNLPYPTIPNSQSFPLQEQGTRVSRALPYQFVVSDAISAQSLSVTIQMTGTEGSAMIAFDVLNLAKQSPLKYAVEAGKVITATWPVIDNTGAYSFTLQGPNGFVRNFVGNTTSVTTLMANLAYNVEAGSVVITMINQDADTTANFMVVDNAYNQGGPWTASVSAQSSNVLELNMSPTGYWYDFTVTAEWDDASASASSSHGHHRRHHHHQPSRAVVHDRHGQRHETASALPSAFMRRFAGRMETGMDTITDPAMASGVPTQPIWPQTYFPRSNAEHPKLSERFTHLKPSTATRHARAGEVEIAEPGKAHKDTLHRWTPAASYHTEL